MQPNMEYEMTQDDLNSQFNKLPGVMDEMIDMANKTKMLFSNSQFNQFAYYTHIFI